MISVLKLVTNLVKVNRFGEKVRSLTESSRRKLAEALAIVISVDTLEPWSLWVSWDGAMKCTK